GRGLNYFNPNFAPGLQGSYIASAPLLYGEHANAMGLTSIPGLEGSGNMWMSPIDVVTQKAEIEKKLADMQTPPKDDDELQLNYYNLPGTNEFPKPNQGNEQ